MINEIQPKIKFQNIVQCPFNDLGMLLVRGGGAQYKSHYGDVSQTWVTKSALFSGPSWYIL